MDDYEFCGWCSDQAAKDASDEITALRARLEVVEAKHDGLQNLLESRREMHRVNSVLRSTEAYRTSIAGKDPVAAMLIANLEELYTDAEARAERAEAALRMIVSHATGGETTGEGMSVNDISVRITAFRNVVYEGGKDVGAKKAEAALATARRDALDLVAEGLNEEGVEVDDDIWCRVSLRALANEAETSARGMPCHSR